MSSPLLVAGIAVPAVSESLTRSPSAALDCFAHLAHFADSLRPLQSLKQLPAAIMGNTHSAVICRRDSHKELLRAAEAGDAQVLNSLLRSDARLLFHYSVFGGNSAWHKAAKGGHAAVLEALEAAVQRHYEQDNKDLNEILKPSVLRIGTTAADVVARLVNKSNVKGFTPLMLACSGNHTEVVAWLIKHGAPGGLNACLAGHCSCWCQAPHSMLQQLAACLHMNVSCSSLAPHLLRLLVQVLTSGSTTVSGGTQPCTVRQRLAQRMPFACCWHVPVMSSTLATTERKCWQQHPVNSVVQLMLQSTRNAAGQGCQHGLQQQQYLRFVSTFILRCCFVRLALCFRLLEQGNHAGLTALHYAVYCEQHEVVAQLVAQDADITAQAEFPDLDWGCINAGDTAMHIAAHKGNIDAIQIMLKAYVSAH